MRPDWDSYFMKIAYAVSERSTCDRAFVGCVLVTDKRILTTGFQRLPRRAGTLRRDRTSHSRWTLCPHDPCRNECHHPGRAPRRLNQGSNLLRDTFSLHQLY